jgi:putative transposase
MSFQKNNKFEANVFYHIYNRGNRKKKIFLDQQDYERFLSSMYRFINDYNLIIYSYCLMPNHFHILLNSGSSPSEITFFMHRFMTSYSLYLNKKYSLVGRVFQSSYKYKSFRTKEGFEKITSYIRENPVNAGLVKDSIHYKWFKETRLAKTLPSNEDF